MKKYPFILLAICFLFIINFVEPLPIGSCVPQHCPYDYYESNPICNNGTCYITCSNYLNCSTNYTTVYTDSEYLPNNNLPSTWGSFEDYIQIGNFTPNNSGKCYRFRQSTPNNFISSSNIYDYFSLSDFDAGIALHWIDESNNSMWYNHQRYYSTGDNNYYIPSEEGAVWVDSCADDGDNFNSADSFINYNNVYCAPTKKACDSFNFTYCDSGCYGVRTELGLTLSTEIADGKGCNNFNDFDNSGSAAWEGRIDYVNFDAQTIYMYVDEFNATLNDSFNYACIYWPQCNPADLCCDSNGYFRQSGFVCKLAHNESCNNINSTACGGIAYEDRCDGTNSQCPDNNYLITYNEACDNRICVNQSCSGSTLQPERTCSSGTCQRNDAYDCPNNLNCQNAVSCKSNVSSSSDCKSGYIFDSKSKVCWANDSAYEDNLYYDLNGNLISEHGLNFSYNNFNQLANITSSNNSSLIAVYSYDDEGNRIKEITYDNSGKNTTVYYFDNFVQIINSSGVYNETYYYYYGNLIAKKNFNNNFFFYHPDILGSTNIITNNSGALFESLSYNPFGELITNTSERYTYTGHQNDVESGLIYMKARYYNPDIAKFTQPDSTIQDIYNPQNLNKYSYVTNNPYKYRDPNGEFIQIAIGGAAGGLVASGYALYKQLVLGEYMSAQDVLSSVGVGVAAGAVFAGTWGLVSPALGEGILAGIGTGTVAGVTSGETELITNSVLSGNINNLKDPIAHAETVGYGGLFGGIFGGVGEGINNGMSIFRGGGTLKPNSLLRTSEGKFGVTEHAFIQAQKRGISKQEIINTINNGEHFKYLQKGTSEIGYFDSKSKIFAATIQDKTKKIATVIKNVKQNYINNLKRRL